MYCQLDIEFSECLCTGSQYLRGKYEGTINWRLLCLRGTESRTVLSVLLNWVSFVFLVTEVAAGGRGQCVMWHCRAAVPRARAGCQCCPVSWTGGQGWLWSCSSCPGHLTPTWRCFAAGHRLLAPSLPAASSNVMCCFCGSAESGWRFVLQGSAVPGLASLSGKGINTEKG